MKTPNAGRVCRGGSWFVFPWICRATFRTFFVAPPRFDRVGFRVARKKR
jgi:formylglycine-generating enzyme required for sulfatase activity